MQLKWNMCQGDVWCKLNAVNLEHEHFNNMHGVYVIWHGGTDPKVVYVGQGNIKERLSEHRRDPRIQSFDYLDLYVTWAAVPEEYRDAIELYLANSWAPRVGKHQPEVPPMKVAPPPMKVNSPWQ